jgi:hypothetical protein
MLDLARASELLPVTLAQGGEAGRIGEPGREPEHGNRDRPPGGRVLATIERTFGGGSEALLQPEVAQEDAANEGIGVVR